MLDNKIYTFLKLCELMNYRETAETLCMTQPAVTQQIKSLENQYGTKLFEYKDRKLTKLQPAILLEKYARAAYNNEVNFISELSSTAVKNISIGATKTIGDYVINEKISRLVDNEKISLSLIIDNTENLLNLLDHSKIQVALIEGYFNKKAYNYQLIRKEPFIGICSKSHPFNGSEIEIESLFSQNLVLRESGSGTRAIFEQMLLEESYSISSFNKISCISSFELIKALVMENKGISFVYEAIANSDNNLGRFYVKGKKTMREFNYVYLKDTDAQNCIELLNK